MAKQIIVTQNDYGIELETQFVDDKKKPLDITDYDVRVKIIYDDKTIDTILAGHKDSVNGIAYIVLEKEHLINAGLHTSVWSVVDEDEHVTAQENVYYFVKDVEGSEDDTPTTDLPIDADGVLNKFNEIDNNLFELTEQGNVVNEELSVVNEQLDRIEKKTKISITDYGAKGDGLTDNTSTIQSAINKCLEIYNTTNVKCCLYIPKGKYKISNYLELRDSSIDIYCDGEIFQDVNCKYGFKFYNMKNMELKINISSNATVESFVQSTAISEQVNGLIVGVQLLGCQRIKLDMNFNQFYGRGIESIGSWQFNNGRISGVVGQAIFVKKPTSEQIGLASGIGELGHYYVEELTGSYFNGLDISVAYYENYIGYHSTNPCSKGVIFDDCTSLWLGNISIGCTSADYLISFLECSCVNFDHLYVYGNWSNTGEKDDSSAGILIRRCFNINGNIHTLKCKSNALTIVGLRNSSINCFGYMNENSGVIKNASDYDVSASEISLSERNRYGLGLYLNNDSNGSILIDGLKLTVNAINQISTNVNKEDLIINDPNAIVDVRGRMINAKFVENNNIRQYATITTLSGAKAKFDFNNMLTDYWTDFTPSITWNTGTPTGISTYCRYKQIGKTVFVKLKILCTNANGTDGFTDITLPLPIRKTFYNVINPYCIVANTTKRTEYFEINYSPNTGKMRSYFASPVASGNLELYLDFVYETD